MLSYTDRGAGIPVVFLHGIGDSKEVTNAFEVIFFRKGYRVISFDLPGHGSSGSLDTSHKDLFLDIANSVIGSLDKLGVKKFALVGISFGGTVAMHIAKMHPGRVKALVLQGPPVLGKDLGWAVRRLYKIIHGLRRPFNGSNVLFHLANKIPPIYEVARKRMGLSEALEISKERSSRELDVEFWGLCVRALVDVDARSCLNDFTGPVLLVDGALASFKFTDTTLKLAELIRNTPGALEVALLPDSGHELPREKPFKFAGCIVYFLNRNCSTS